MSDLNRCEFIGRLGADPESRFAPSGTEVTKLRIAVTKKWKDKQTHEKKESTQWIPIVAFDSLAGVCSRFLAKGSRIYVAGQWSTRQWEDQEGNTRYKTEVIANELQMLDSRQGEQGQQSPTEPSTPQDTGGMSDDEFRDDIPF